MLAVYKTLEERGVIGRLQKVDAAGNVIVDIAGDKPGTLVTRPFSEFPKIVRRYSHDGRKVYENVVNSKNEELRVLAENPDTTETVRSPLEIERDTLAVQNAEQNKVIMTLQEKMDTMMAQMSTLAAKVDQASAEKVALGSTQGAATSASVASAHSTGKGLEALAMGKRT
jgi:hypothetical protein